MGAILMAQTEEIHPEHIGRVVVPGPFVRITGETARVAIPGQEDKSQPRVELVRQGDVVQAIEITCTCGQRIRLRCVYS